MLVPREVGRGRDEQRGPRLVSEHALSPPRRTVSTNTASSVPVGVLEALMKLG